MEVGQKLKQARLKAKLTQDQVSEAIQVSRQTLSNWENERYCPDIVSVIKLSDLYNTSLDELLKGEKMKTDNNVFANVEGQKNILIFNLGTLISDSSPYSLKMVRAMKKVAKIYKMDLTVKETSYKRIDSEGNEADIILLSPELYGREVEAKTKYPDKIVQVIDKRDYGLVDAENVLKKYCNTIY